VCYGAGNKRWGVPRQTGMKGVVAGGQRVEISHPF
jgi:hypothetical protein